MSFMLSLFMARKEASNVALVEHRIFNDIKGGVREEERE